MYDESKYAVITNLIVLSFEDGNWMKHSVLVQLTSSSVNEYVLPFLNAEAIATRWNLCLPS
jgi:hypothetical protein